MYKILVVDDEEKIRDVLEGFLTRTGFEVVKASGGQEAIKILKSDIKLDLLILDVKMPGLTGREVLLEMAGLRKVIPVILLTGSITAEKYLPSLQERGIQLGREDICYKPVDLFVLLDLVKKKLGASAQH